MSIVDPQQIFRLPTEVQQSLSVEAINLLKKIFQVDADKRPSAREILNDPWLQDAVKISQS
jgi:serine/threonine protein kinase